MGECLFGCFFFFWQKNRKEWAESGGATFTVLQRHLVATLNNDRLVTLTGHNQYNNTSSDKYSVNITNRWLGCGQFFINNFICIYRR